MPRRLKTMSLEQCAKRMTNFLARKPKAKTAAYVATLPKREPIKVTPLDYVSCPFERSRMQSAGIGMRIDPAADALHRAAMVARDAKRLAEWEARGKPPSPSLPPKAKRKDRMRPSVREPEYQRLMVRMVDAQAGLCFLCGLALSADTSLAQNDPLRASFDHVVPVSRGGVNERNRLAAHRSCNGGKADRMPTGCETLFLEAVNLHLFA